MSVRWVWHHCEVVGFSLNFPPASEDGCLSLPQSIKDHFLCKSVLTSYCDCLYRLFITAHPSLSTLAAKYGGVLAMLGLKNGEVPV